MLLLARNYISLFLLTLLLAQCWISINVSAVSSSTCPEGIRTRKSLRALSSKERADFVLGVQRLKANGKLDRLTRFHRQGMKYHGTIHFLSMHRALMKEFEDELIRANPRITGVPYWDEAVDAVNPSRSPVFSQELMGPVRSGVQHYMGAPFLNLLDDNNKRVTRYLRNMTAGISWMPQNQILARVLSRFNNFGDMAQAIEITPHNMYHTYIGGHMGNPMFSPSDPIFWVHHSYIDMLWATWQSLRPQNYENIDSWNGQQRLALNSRVVMYENRYTMRDVLRYRDRLCYHYEVMNIREMNTKSYLKKRDDMSLDPLTYNVTVYSSELDYSNNTSYNQTNESTVNSTEETDRRMLELPGDLINITSFLKLQSLSDEEILLVQPNADISEWRAVQSDINNIIEDLNSRIEDGTLNTTTLKTLHDLYIEGEANNTMSNSTDDFKDTAIPEIQNLSAHLSQESSSTDTQRITTLSYIIILIVGVLF